MSCCPGSGPEAQQSFQEVMSSSVFEDREQVAIGHEARAMVSSDGRWVEAVARKLVEAMQREIKVMQQHTDKRFEDLMQKQELLMTRLADHQDRLERRDRNYQHYNKSSAKTGLSLSSYKTTTTTEASLHQSPSDAPLPEGAPPKERNVQSGGHSLALPVHAAEGAPPQMATPAPRLDDADLDRMPSPTGSVGSYYYRRNTMERATFCPAALRLTQHPYFDLFFCGAILVNAVCIGAEVEYRSTYPDDMIPFNIIAYAFCILWIMEIFIRFIAVGGYFFEDPEMKLWNVFDTLMAVLAIVEVTDEIFRENSTEEKSPVLTFFRMMRLLRVVRVLRFLPQLRLMIMVIVESIKCLGSLAFLLVMILYIFSICFTIAATDYLRPDADGPPRHEMVIRENYGTIARSIYTCFKAATGGVSWGEISDPLVDMGAVYLVIFLVYIVFTTLCILNIVTGVFVDGAFAKSQSERDLVADQHLSQKKAFIKNLKELFEQSDADGSGHISIAEFTHILATDRVEAYFSALKIDTSSIDELFKILDKDGDGEISIDEFVDNLIYLVRGQSIEQYVQRLVNESRAVVHKLHKLKAFTQGEFRRIREIMQESQVAEGPI